MEFFSNSTSFLLKKSYIPSNIAPFNYPGTLWVIGLSSGPDPGNGKSKKTGSGPGTPLPSIYEYPGNSLPGPTLVPTSEKKFKFSREIPFCLLPKTIYIINRRLMTMFLNTE